MNLMNVVGFVSICAVVGCAGKTEKQSTGECANPSVDGYQTIVGDITREYILHVPSGYDGSSALPLVIAYHGNGGCADQFAAYEAQLESTADSNGFLLAYPQGVARAKGAAEWDPGDDGSQSISTNDLARTWTKDSHLDHIRFTDTLTSKTLDLYTRDTSLVELLFDMITDLDVLVEPSRILFLFKPLGAPGTDDAKSKTNWMCLLSHDVLLNPSRRAHK